MPSATRVLISILKLAPLGICNAARCSNDVACPRASADNLTLGCVRVATTDLRASACHLDLPIFGCDEPLCAAALGQHTVDCVVTGNTAEVKHWCEHGWTPWLNGLLQNAGIPLTTTCTASSGHVLLRVLALVMLMCYVLLWMRPQLGSLLLSVYMGFALHFHAVFLNEPAGVLLLQMGLFTASVAVLALEVLEEENAPVPPKKKAD